MILTDFSNIKIGNTDISSVYMGGEKLWPKGADMSRRIMRFTTTNGNTWNIAQISAYTADNRLIQPIEKTATGWTYENDIEYMTSNRGSTNLLTYDGFDSPQVRYQNKTIGYFSGNTMCNRIETAKMDVSQCFDMTRMFHSCKSMKSFDVGNWDVSNCSNMLQMFFNCTGATSIDVANWNVSNVERMSDMFRNCYSLKNLDVSKWNTKSLRYMGMTFRSCRALETLDVSNWNVSHVESMNYAFAETALKTLDVSKWVTRSATSMKNMFSNCTGLTSLNLANWDVSKVTAMTEMFMNCSNLTTINMENWFASNTTNMSHMFSGCTSLKTIYVCGCNDIALTKINAALKEVGLDTAVEVVGCPPELDKRVLRFRTTDGNTWNKDYISAYTADNRLIEPTEKNATGWTYGEDVEYLGTLINVSTIKGNLSTFNGFGVKTKIRNAFKFFYNEADLTEINTELFDTSETTDMSFMFSGAMRLTSLDVSHFDTSKVADMQGMFELCDSLTSLDVSNFNTSQVTNMSRMFSDCSSLTSLNLSNWNTSQVTNMKQMFDYCSGLASLDLSNWDTSKVTNMSGMFGRCFALKTITMKNCSQETVDKIKSALQSEGILDKVTIITS